MNSLGFLAAGEGDLAGARTWWEQAAAEGHPGAMYNRGVLAAGEGDVAGARDWYERAAEEGNTEAGTELKRLLTIPAATGLGQKNPVDPDSVQTSAKARFCEQCGATRSTDARFCGECGREFPRS